MRFLMNGKHGMLSFFFLPLSPPPGPEAPRGISFIANASKKQYLPDFKFKTDDPVKSSQSPYFLRVYIIWEERRAGQLGDRHTAGRKL